MRLSSFPFVVVRLACGKCARRGQYRLARLADRYGAECELTTLLEQLSADCRLREKAGRSPNIYDRCGAHFLDLTGPPRPPDVPDVGRKRLRVVRG